MFTCPNKLYPSPHIQPIFASPRPYTASPARNLFGPRPAQLFAAVADTHAPRYRVPPTPPSSPATHPFPPPRRRFGAPVGLGHQRSKVIGHIHRSFKFKNHFVRAEERRRREEKASNHAKGKGKETNLNRLEGNVQRLANARLLSAEDQIFLKQMNALSLEHKIRTTLTEAREEMDRAVAEAPLRRRRWAERDRRVEQMLRREKIRREVEEERKAEEERIREEIRLEEQRKYEELSEEAKREREQARIRTEAFRSELKAEREKFEREAKEELLRKAKEQAERKAKAQVAAEKAIRERMARQKRAQEHAKRAEEESEREARDRKERDRAKQERAAMEEAERRRLAAYFEAEQEAQSKVYENAPLFAVYEAKWQELKAGFDLRMLRLSELPWPVQRDVHGPGDITITGVTDFVFHPGRVVMAGKSRKERLRAEMLRWHPDKFNAKVLIKVEEWERAATAETAGAVARILTQMMKEEDAQGD